MKCALRGFTAASNLLRTAAAAAFVKRVPSLAGCCKCGSNTNKTLSTSYCPCCCTRYNNDNDPVVKRSATTSCKNNNEL